MRLICSRACLVCDEHLHNATPMPTRPQNVVQLISQFCTLFVSTTQILLRIKAEVCLHLLGRPLQHPINLRQREQLRQTTPPKHGFVAYVVRHNPNQFHYQLVLGYLMLHEFSCAHGSNRPHSTGSISIRP